MTNPDLGDDGDKGLARGVHLFGLLGHELPCVATRGAECRLAIAWGRRKSGTAGEAADRGHLPLDAVAQVLQMKVVSDLSGLWRTLPDALGVEPASVVADDLANAAIPGIFPPVRIDGQTLMDGAIATNTPIQAAADLGASRLVMLPTGYACALKEPPKGAIDRALHAITLLIEWQLIRDLERLTDQIHVCIVPTLCPLDVSPYDFSASHYLMQRAADSTRKWLDGGGLSRRSRPQELQAHRH